MLLSVAAICSAIFTGCAVQDSGTNASGGNSSSGSSSGGTIAARIGDQEITLQELDAKVQRTNSKVYQAFFDARKQALDGMVGDALLDAEAESRGISQADLVNEITAKLPTVTDADIADFFNKNQAQMRGRTLEQIGPQIRSHLETTHRQGAMQSFVTGLRRDAEVSVFLEPPRVEVRVASNNPSKGPVGAPIQLIEFSEFQ